MVLWHVNSLYLVKNCNETQKECHSILHSPYYWKIFEKIFIFYVFQMSHDQVLFCFVVLKFCHYFSRILANFLEFIIIVFPKFPKWFVATIKMTIMTICIQCQNLKLIFHIKRLMRITIWRFSKWQS